MSTAAPIHFAIPDLKAYGGTFDSWRTVVEIEIYKCVHLEAHVQSSIQMAEIQSEGAKVWDVYHFTGEL